MPKQLTVEEAKKILMNAGITVSSEKRLGNDSGTQLIVPDAFVNVYDKGTYYVQGKKAQEVRSLLEHGGSPETNLNAHHQQLTQAPADRRVFVVYGRDQKCLDDLELLLRRLKFEPVVLQNLPAAGDTIIEKLENSTDTDFACVLLTPDDEGRLKHKEGASEEPLRPRRRQNVVLEMGMVLARLGRKRVALIVQDVQGNKIERPTDIDGLLYLPFENEVDEIKNDLAAWLEKLGFHIAIADLKG